MTYYFPLSLPSRLRLAHLYAMRCSLAARDRAASELDIIKIYVLNYRAHMAGTEQLAAEKNRQGDR